MEKLYVVTDREYPDYDLKANFLIDPKKNLWNFDRKKAMIFNKKDADTLAKKFGGFSLQIEKSDTIYPFVVIKWRDRQI